ncbi:hypothetical protein BFP97_16445 [Roseivirga sp. 4D4]|uniref:helix-turn-helix domain-containing protein n=1 Tax=Roseivirga sp. 4D4 TaxID=1889784 RepID=UPI000852DC70|nr:helix-turn-helix domain-containing protein [Roseivirga sp. 4D4]OEK03014.1 hypothetical protein BFP97_16445 [Roseivirga sp. 4D4]
MNVICLEEEAFHSLIEEVVKRMSAKVSIVEQEADWKWISDVQAMELLKIKSKTTLQELRDNGEVRFSQPRKKIILYDRDSINEYLERHARETF